MVAWRPVGPKNEDPQPGRALQDEVRQEGPGNQSVDAEVAQSFDAKVAQSFDAEVAQSFDAIMAQSLSFRIVGNTIPKSKPASSFGIL